MKYKIIHETVNDGELKEMEKINSTDSQYINNRTKLSGKINFLSFIVAIEFFFIFLLSGFTFWQYICPIDDADILNGLKRENVQLQFREYIKAHLERFDTSLIILSRIIY